MRHGPRCRSAETALLTYTVPMPNCWQKSCPTEPCQIEGTCNPETGECEYTAAPDGTVCDSGVYFHYDTDDDAVYAGECRAGACVATTQGIWRTERGLCVDKALEHLPYMYRMGMSAEECQRACARRFECRAYVHDADKCALFLTLGFLGTWATLMETVATEGWFVLLFVAFVR